MIAIPAFKEVYFNEVDGAYVKTICNIIVLEDFKLRSDKLIKNGDKLAFGMSKSRKSTYNESVGKRIAYAMAMRFVFLRITGEKNVDDRTNFSKTQTA